VAPDPEATIIEFPGMVELWDRFWNEIPKTSSTLIAQIRGDFNDRHATPASDGT
jgi:hypothetical protein